MINNKLRDYLAEEHEESFVFNILSYDNAIIGTSEEHIVYDFNLMVEEYMFENQANEEEACEYLEYNVIRALPYIEERVRPIIVFNSSIIKEIKNDSDKT